MYKHTITRVRPNTGVQWPYETEGGVAINSKYSLTNTKILSDDGLTKQAIREISDSSSDIYWITAYCDTNGITTTFTTEQV